MLAFGPGLAAWGLVTGVAMTQSGLGVGLSILMSLTVYAGSAQLASLPLLHQPGAEWNYGFGLDVLGLVVEQITEQSLGHYMAENIWRPLGMVDTGFVVPGDKADRYAKPLPNDPDTGRPVTIRPR